MIYHFYSTPSENIYRFLFSTIFYNSDIHFFRFDIVEGLSMFEHLRRMKRRDNKSRKSVQKSRKCDKKIRKYDKKSRKYEKKSRKCDKKSRKCDKKSRKCDKKSRKYDKKSRKGISELVHLYSNHLKKTKFCTIKISYFILSPNTYF